MSCKVGNQTNSQDPQAVNARVFVGNLNTFQCSKTDVERRFQRYGRIAGISMHKGYAFIQFTNPFDARSACLGEDARLLWGQTLDVNMVAEPKSHQTGRKRQNIAKTGNDWDYYYDSYYAQVGFPPAPRLLPPMKRPRIHLPPPLTQRPPRKNNVTSNNKTHSDTSLSDLKSYSTPDILICGNCRELFSDVEQLMEHKKSYCKLRFTCKCHTHNGCAPKSSGEEHASLLCSQCKDSFHTAWDLMVHVQAAHMLNIYQLGNDTTTSTSTSTTTSDLDQTEGIVESEGMDGAGVVTNEVGTLLNDMEDSNSHGEKHNSENNSLVLPPTSTSTSTSHGHSSELLVEESNGRNENFVAEAEGDVKFDYSASTTMTLTSPEEGKPMGRITPGFPYPGYPMEASTQTQMDNPNTFDEHHNHHCSLLSSMHGTSGIQCPLFGNGLTPIESKTT